MMSNAPFLPRNNDQPFINEVDSEQWALLHDKAHFYVHVESINSKIGPMAEKSHNDITYGTIAWKRKLACPNFAKPRNQNDPIDIKAAVSEQAVLHKDKVYVYVPEYER
jgi:hypothetical protein